MFEEPALNAVRAAQAPGIDSDPLSELMLHRPVRFEGRDEFRIEALERFALLIEENDALGREAVL